MSLRIDRIQVKPGGPLEQPVDWSCGDLTLAYGPNETGKSYVVEFLVECLFRTGTRSGSGWDLREWNARGGVTVSGIANGPVKMTVSNKDKLDKIWEDDPRGLPGDLCRLLVVTQGTTRLSEEETADGIERNLLRELFSGEYLIESIRNSKALPKSAATASFESGTIGGSGQWSDKGERERVLGDIGMLEDLVDRFNDQISHGAIASLTSRLKQLEAQRGELEAARQYRANQLAIEHETLNERLNTLPSTEAIEQVSADLRALRKARIGNQTKQERQQDLARQQDDLAWASSALANYDRIISARPQAPPPPWLAIAAGVVLLVAVVAGLFGHAWGLGLLALVAAGLGAAHVWWSRKPATPEPDDPVELGRIAAEFERRFDEPLGDRASLEHKIEALKKLGNEAEILAGQLDDETAEARAETDRIGRRLTEWAERELTEDDWDGELESLRTKHQQLDRHVRVTQSERDRLGIAADGETREQPETPWDVEHYEQLLGHIRQAEEDLERESGAQVQLLEEARRSVSRSTTSDWESLLAALESDLDDLRATYRDVTARMIAQYAVHEVLDAVSAEEAEMINEGLERAVIQDSIRLMCPRYHSLRDGEEGLVVVDGDENEFSVGSLSTGAREQVFLGARLGFARIALDNQPAFLVLDDAFQHSDWDRRQRLVDQAVTLVEAGWQVLYFTMDDHIRDLFDTVGEQLGDRYVSLVLPEPTSPTNGD